MQLAKSHSGNPENIFEWIQAQNQKVSTKFNELRESLGNQSFVEGFKNVAADMAKDIKIEP